MFLSCSEALRPLCNSSPQPADLITEHLSGMKMYLMCFSCWLDIYKLRKLLRKRLRFQSSGFDHQLQQKLQILEIIWRPSGGRACALHHQHWLPDESWSRNLIQVPPARRSCWRKRRAEKNMRVCRVDQDWCFSAGQFFPAITKRVFKWPVRSNEPPGPPLFTRYTLHFPRWTLRSVSSTLVHLKD